MTEAGCWAHARRKIHDVYISTKSATAEEALKLIGELYAIEHEIRGLPVSERLAVRQMQSKPLLTSLYKLMQERFGLGVDDPKHGFTLAELTAVMAGFDTHPQAGK